MSEKGERGADKVTRRSWTCGDRQHAFFPFIEYIHCWLTSRPLVPETPESAWWVEPGDPLTMQSVGARSLCAIRLHSGITFVVVSPL